jgi:uncharacterized protein (DUF2141 family)
MTLAKHLLATSLILAAGVASARAAEVIILIDGVETGRGTVAVAMCDKGPLDKCRQFSGKSKATAETLGYQFADIPAGKYAFVATQDINESGENERNMLGMPKEPFAVGSPETSLMPPPTHEAIAAEIVDGRSNVIRMTLRTMTGTQKKKGVPVKELEEVQLIPVDLASTAMPVPGDRKVNVAGDKKTPAAAEKKQ